MTDNIIKYKKLTKEQFVYIRKNLSKSARILKKYTSKVKKKQRVQFRDSVLGAWRDGSVDMKKLAYALERVPVVEHDQFLEDIRIVYTTKSPHEFLNGQTVEDALISGYIPLFTKWCMGKPDMVSEFLVKVLDSIYLYTKPECSLIEYLKFCYKSISKKSMMNNSSLIKYPVKWNFLRLSFDETLSKNPFMTVDEVMQSMNLTDVQKNKLRQQIDLTSTVSMSEFDSIQRIEQDEIPTLGINLDDVPMTDLQRKSIDAYMSGDWGWQTKMAAETINPETGKPYSKMTVNNSFKAAIEAIKEYMELRNE